jgi:hypothetical protein
MGKLDDYYQNCAYPKPRSAKKKRKMNGWKNKVNRFCAYCGKPYAERHEVFCGSNRQISIDNKFQVDACRAHHEELHSNSTDWAQAENERLKKLYQQQYESKLIDEGYTDEQARRAWMLLIGRNYL